MFITLADWLERNSFACFYRKYLGVDCPGCGMQRSLAELLRGNFISSLEYYPALLPTVFLVIYLGLHLFFKFRNGATVLKFSFIFTAIIIVAHYIYKLINQ